MKNDLAINQLADHLVKIAQESTNDGITICTIIGGGGSGKSTLSALLDRPNRGIISISVDDYVKGDRDFRRNSLESGDPRDKYDFKEMDKKIDELRLCNQKGKVVSVPQYDEKTGFAIDAPKSDYRKISCPIEIVFIEGVFAGHVKHPELIFFLDTSEKLRLKNRITRASTVRKEGDIEEVKKNFEEREKKEFRPFALPLKEKSNYVISVEYNDDQFIYSLEKMG